MSTTNPNPNPNPNPPQQRRRLLEAPQHVGKHHCGIHDFETADTDQFERHQEEPGHFQTTGSFKCFQCGNQVPITEDNKISYKSARDGKVFHQQCKEVFLSGV